MQTVERDRLALEMLFRAMDIAPIDQATWVDTETKNDAALRSRVLALLSAVNTLTDLNETAGLMTHPLPPSEVGVYRLVQMIGAGGMGSVYRAERIDGLFDQTVAIKFMAARQGRLDLGPLIDAERRALARMDHDNIARILDGGQTAGGLHYLVMEFVDGAPINAAPLMPLQAVNLIRQVAAALAHAHQVLIVHCDIKPGNILVTVEGRVKLIDFGIARLQHMDPAGGLDGMTRAYASPERCQLAAATLADDVYALAVTLSELLTGQLPWSDPARHDPATAPVALDLSNINGLHNPADLIAILTKALAAQTTQRYRSIEAFDDDLARWQTKRPVSAVPQAFSYLAKRFAQRRPLPVLAALGGLGLLIAALAVISNLYLAANTARQTADSRFTELRSLARFMIFDLNSQLEQLPGATPARLALSVEAQGYLDILGQTAQGDQGLQREVATGLLRLAEVQGVPSRPNLGLTDLALVNLDKAVLVFDRLIAAFPGDTVLLADRGRALYFLAVTRGVHDQDPVLQKSLADRAEADVVAALGPATGAVRGDLQVLLLGVRLTQADALTTLSDHAAALTLRRAEEARIVGLSTTERGFMDWNYEAGRVAAQVGDSLYWLGETAASRAAYDRASARFSAGLLDDPLNRKLLNGLHYTLYSLSATMADQGDFTAGLTQARASADVAQRLLDWDPTDRLSRQMYEASQGQIALMLRRNGRLGEAISMIQAQLLHYRAVASAQPEDAAARRQIAVPMRGLAEMILEAQGKAAGCAAYAQAQAAWDDLNAAFGLTDLDRNNDLASIALAMAENHCP